MPGFEGGQTPLIRRIPKRGFSNKAFRKRLDWVNVGELKKYLNKKEKSGEKTDSVHDVKLLGKGQIGKPMELKVRSASKAAVSKVTQAGGKVLLI